MCKQEKMMIEVKKIVLLESYPRVITSSLVCYLTPSNLTLSEGVRYGLVLRGKKTCMRYSHILYLGTI